jgi:hypothetical protein
MTDKSYNNGILGKRKSPQLRRLILRVRTEFILVLRLELRDSNLRDLLR